MKNRLEWTPSETPHSCVGQPLLMPYANAGLDSPDLDPVWEISKSIQIHVREVAKPAFKENDPYIPSFMDQFMDPNEPLEFGNST